MSEMSQQQIEQVLSSLNALSQDIEGIKERRTQDKSRQIQQWALVVIGGLGVMFTIQETFKASIREISDLQNKFLSRRLDEVDRKLDRLDQDRDQTLKNTQAILQLKERHQEWLRDMANPVPRKR